ncbi:MAG: tyrosine-type recombinase/integrase [Lactococcus lactis]
MASIRYRQRKGKSGVSWSYEIRQGDKTLKSKSGFKTKKDASIDGLSILREFKAGLTIDKNTDLPTLYQEWYNLKVLHSGRSEQTLYKYRYFGKIIKNNFDGIPITSIKSSQYQRIMNKLGTDDKISYNTLIRVNSVIRQTIEMLQADNVFIKDFTTSVVIQSKFKPQTADEKYIHSLEDYNKIIEYLKDNLDYKKSINNYIVYFLFHTGLRYGELVALTWSDIDFENGYLKTYRRYNTNINKFVPSKTETSIRRVPLSSTDISILNDLKKTQEFIVESLGFENKYNLIFYHPFLIHGIPHSTTINNHLALLLKQLNIEPVITSKGARHTYGSVLLANGYSMDIVAKILGHKDIMMLVRVYGHALDENIAKQIESIKRLLD